jgi:hypothetical protein
MDDPKTKLQLTRGIFPLCWVLQVKDIQQATKNFGYEPGEVITMSMVAWNGRLLFLKMVA